MGVNMRTIEELPEISMDDPGFLADPAHAFSEALSQAPVWRSKRGVEVLSYDLCKNASHDKRLWVNNLRDVEALGIPDGPVLDFKRRMILGQGYTDDRTAIRQVLGRVIGPEMAEQMRGDIRTIVNELLDELVAKSGGAPADLFDDFCMLLPARLYCHWVGAPKEDAHFAARISEAVMRIFLLRKSDIPTILAAYDELFPYIRQQVERSRSAPQDNVLGRLLALADGGKLSEVQVNDFAVMLLEASVENTSHQVALVVGALLEDSDSWARIVADRSLIDGAVEEATRLHSRVGRLKRYVREDMEIGGVHLPAETSVILVTWAAHMDPAAFPDPSRLDVSRRRDTRILTFGGGAFSCIGQYVATLEAVETLGALADRFPNSHVVANEAEYSLVRKSSSSLKVALRA